MSVVRLKDLLGPVTRVKKKKKKKFGVGWVFSSGVCGRVCLGSGMRRGWCGRLMMKLVALLVLSLALTASATDADGTKYLAENKEKPGVITTASGLQYKVLTAGSGAHHPTVDSACEVHYEGIPRQSVGGGKCNHNRSGLRYPLLKTTALRGKLLLATTSKTLAWSARN